MYILDTTYCRGRPISSKITNQTETLTTVAFTFYELTQKIWMNFVINSRGGKKKLNRPFKTRLGVIFNNTDVTIAVVDRAAENKLQKYYC